MSHGALAFRHTTAEAYDAVLRKVWWDAGDVQVYRDLPTRDAAKKFMQRAGVRRSPANSRLTKKEWVDEALSKKGT